MANLHAIIHASWLKLKNAEMFLNVRMIASSVLGVPGWVLALLASVLVSLFLFKLERDLFSRMAMVFVAVLGRNESAILIGAKKTVKLVIGLNGDLVSQLVLVLGVHRLVRKPALATFYVVTTSRENLVLLLKRLLLVIFAVLLTVRLVLGYLGNITVPSWLMVFMFPIHAVLIEESSNTHELSLQEMLVEPLVPIVRRFLNACLQTPAAQ